MKICILARSFEAGGAERQFVQLARTLARRGHAVQYVVLDGSGPLVRCLEGYPGVDVVPLSRGGIIGKLLAIVRACRLIRISNPDLVYSFLTGPNIISGLVALRRAAPPVVWGFRGEYVVGSGTSLRGRIAEFLLRYMRPQIRWFVANSCGGCRELIAHGYPSERVIFIGNGFDGSEFYYSASERSSWRTERGFGGELVVGLLARHDPLKDIPTLLRAIQRCYQTEPRIRLVVSGADPWGCRADHEEVARALGISSIVQWLPPTENARAFFSGLDLMCLSSRSEGFPNVVGEAMACECPVVSTDVGEVGALLGDPARICPAGDPEALARLIQQNLKGHRSPELRERVLQAHSLERVAQRTEELARTCLTKGSTSSLV